MFSQSSRALDGLYDRLADVTRELELIRIELQKVNESNGKLKDAVDKIKPKDLLK